jgi:membrane associated rhomboid family serine protease
VAAEKSGNGSVDDGVFALIALSLAGFVADHVLKLPAMQNLYLPLDGGQWFQYGTAMFCHGDWEHLSGNLFFLFLFGRLVEERIGSLGVMLAFLGCGLGANVISAWMLHEGTLIGASGAVFGLFIVSVLLRLKFEWRRLLEVLILGQFVIAQVMEETERLGVQDGVSHLTHVGGAITGAVFVAAITRLINVRD